MLPEKEINHKFMCQQMPNMLQVHPYQLPWKPESFDAMIVGGWIIEEEMQPST